MAELQNKHGRLQKVPQLSSDALLRNDVRKATVTLKFLSLFSSHLIFSHRNTSAEDVD